MLILKGKVYTYTPRFTDKPICITTLGKYIQLLTFPLNTDNGMRIF